jgi:N-acyl-D-amino-acid deacylase
MRRLVLGLFLASVALSAQPPTYDLLLRNGRIVDGTGSPWYRADVAIKGDTIVKIAPAIAEPATRTIDVNGLVVAPGFIDIHTHARRGIFQVPTADNYVRQGAAASVLRETVGNAHHAERCQLRRAGIDPHHGHR